MNKAAASWNRIADALAIEPDMTSPEASAPAVHGAPAVAFDHVSLKYGGAGGESLTDVDFSSPAAARSASSAAPARARRVWWA